MRKSLKSEVERPKDLRVNEAVRVATNVKKRQTDVQDESLEVY